MKTKILIISLILIILLTGCVSSPDNNNTSNGTNEEAPDLNTEGPNGFGIGGDDNSNNDDSNNNNNNANNNNNNNPNDFQTKEEKAKEIAAKSDLQEEQLINLSRQKLEEKERRLNLSQQCKNKGENYTVSTFDSIRIDGETLNPIKFETMVHDSLNDVRERREPLEDPLKCDPKLRDIARQNSRAMIEGQDNYNVREELGVTCQSPYVMSGYWYYRLDTARMPPDNQTVQVEDTITDMDEFLVDVKQVYGRQTGFREVSDPSSEIQGVGVYIQRDTGWTAITQIVC